ncbi:hypothetical protein TCAL_12845, partial [Tigriopus californicus]|eukprot:TCALIF_12845-PA protein Name:"Protein of unknown function" AED:0.93 eAED:0.93 QI:0/0/0/0.2/0.25/0.6/5/0/268
MYDDSTGRELTLFKKISCLKDRLCEASSKAVNIGKSPKFANWKNAGTRSGCVAWNGNVYLKDWGPRQSFDDATMATMDSSMDSSKTYACLKIGEDQSDLASCDASDENSSRGNRSSDESEDGDDINATLTRESDVTHPGIDGNKEVEIIEFWDQESYLSEHHYDEPRIDDSSLNMLNFGDDYRNYIDSLSEDENDLDDIPRRPRHYAPNLMRMQNEIFTLNISLHEIIHELQSVVSLLERRAKAPRVEFQKIQQKMLELYSLWEQVHQ